MAIEPDPVAELETVRRQLAVAREAFDRSHAAHLDDLRALAAEVAAEQARADAAAAAAADAQRLADQERARADRLERRLAQVEASRSYRLASAAAAVSRPLRRGPRRPDA